MSSLENTRLKRKQRIRRKISGTNERPRLTVYKSLKHVYAQAIDDVTGRTLVSASDLDKEIRDEVKANKLKKADVAKRVGALLAKKCLSNNIDKVVFDRNGFPYHGRIEAIASGAREAGLKF